MNLTDKEKQLASRYFADDELIVLLEKIFTPSIDAIEPSLEKMALSLDDAHYGQNMKALAIAKASFGIKMQEVRMLVKKEKGKSAPIAPR